MQGAEMAVLQSTVVQGGRPDVQLQQITTRRILGGFQSRFSEQRRKQKTGKYHCFETPTASPETQLSASPTTHGPPMQLPTVPENSVATPTSMRTHILDLGQPTAQVQNGMGVMVARQTASTNDQTPDDSDGTTELNMDNTADTIDGSKVYSKPWAALSNIYSGYMDLMTGSRYTREDTEDSEDLSGNADDTFRSSMGEVPTNEEYLQAYNKLWKALLDGNLDTIKRLDREGAYLYQQGVHGENIFLKACLYMYRQQDGPHPPELDYYSTYARIIAFLLTNDKHRRALINSEYEGKEYHGETAMHFAIVHDDIDMLRKFHKYGADFEVSRARGNYFSTYSSLYYGQSLLNFAVCTGRTKVVKFLLDEVQVDPNSWDHNGNTALHMMAWWGLYNDSGETQRAPDPSSNNQLDIDAAQDEMIRNALSRRVKRESDNAPIDQNGPNLAKATLLRLWDDLVKRGARTFIRNYDDYTPFLVAVQRRNVGMVMAIIESTRQPVFDYDLVAGYRYPLTDIDIPKPKVRVDKLFSDLDPRKIKNKDRFSKKEKRFDTALEIAINNRDSAMVANIPLLRIVLEAKWTMYGQNMFNWFMFSFVFYQILFLVAQSLTPIGPANALLAEKRLTYLGSGVGIFRLVLECFLVLANIITVWGELRELALLDYSIFSYIDLRADGAHNIFQLANVFLFIGVVISRVCRFSEAEINYLTALNLISWLPLFYFFQGFRNLGPLIAAISRMRFVILRFMAIFFVFYMGFAMAFWVQMSPSVRNDSNSTNLNDLSTNLDVVQPLKVSFNNVTSVYDYLVSSGVNTQAYLNNTIGVLTEKDGTDKKILVRKFRDWFPGTIAWSFGVILQVSERFADLENANSQTFAYALLLFFAFISSIIFINVLIAMLNTTYSEVINEAENVWRIQWASLVLAMDKKIPYKRRREEWALGYFLPRPFTEESDHRAVHRGHHHSRRQGTRASKGTASSRSMSHHERISHLDPSKVNYNSMGGAIENATYFKLQYQKSDWTLLKVITHIPDVDYFGFARNEEHHTIWSRFWSRFWSVSRVLTRSLAGLKVPAMDVGEKIRAVSETRWKAIGARLPTGGRVHRATVGRRGWGG